jgi:hypothetical protein
MIFANTSAKFYGHASYKPRIGIFTDTPRKFPAVRIPFSVLGLEGRGCQKQASTDKDQAHIFPFKLFQSLYVLIYITNLTIKM